MRISINKSGSWTFSKGCLNFTSIDQVIEYIFDERWDIMELFNGIFFNNADVLLSIKEADLIFNNVEISDFIKKFQALDNYKEFKERGIYLSLEFRDLYSTMRVNFKLMDN